MQDKKHPHADLEKKRPMFFQTGLAIALSLALLAFEWASFYQLPEDFATTGEDFVYEDEQIPITVRKVAQPKPKKKIEQQKRETLEILIADDTLTIDLKNDPPEPEDTLAYIAPDPIPTDTAGPDIPFLIVEDMPYICGCEKKKNKLERQACTDEAIFKHLNRKMKYPNRDREAGVEGTVVVNYIVDESGNVVQVNILRSVSPGLDGEAMRVISQLPCYKPGRQRGKPVKVSFNVPINFKLGT